MKSNMGLLANILLGIVGAVLFNFIFGSVLGLYAAGASFSFAYLLAGFVGACILIAIARAVRGRA
ncbi:MAG: GlsB/YeaQ/YmgE family stress response membrane protein [Paracoccus hibiscisoli]